MDIRAASGARKILCLDMDEDVIWIYISLKEEDRSGMKTGRRFEFFVWLASISQSIQDKIGEKHLLDTHAEERRRF